MANATVTSNGNNEYTIQPNGDASVKLATAGTYVDKNIVFNIEGIQVAVEEDEDTGKNVLTFSNLGSN